MTTFREGAEKSEPRIVLSFCGLLVEDDSPLLDDAEWLKEAVDSRSEDEGGDYGAPLLKLSVYPCLTGQEAVDFVKRRSSALPIPQPKTQGETPRGEGWRELRILAEGSSWRRDAGETIEAWAARTIRELKRELAAAKRGVVGAMRVQELCKLHEGLPVTLTVGWSEAMEKYCPICEENDRRNAAHQQIAAPNEEAVKAAQQLLDEDSDPLIQTVCDEILRLAGRKP